MAKACTNLSIEENAENANPNEKTDEAIHEYYEMKNHPERYKRYSSFKDAMKDTFNKS